MLTHIDYLTIAIATFFLIWAGILIWQWVSIYRLGFDVLAMRRETGEVPENTDDEQRRTNCEIMFKTYHVVPSIPGAPFGAQSFLFLFITAS